MSKKTIIIEEGFLKDLYLNKKKSTREIAEVINCSQFTIVKKLKEYNIKGRPPTENKMPVKKGEKISWDLKNNTPEVNKKKSKAMTGRYIPRKGTNPPVAVNCHICDKLFKKKYSYWASSESKIFYCSDHKGNSGFQKGIVPHNKKEKVKTNCNNCNVEMERVQSQFNSYNFHFCSPSCNGEWKSKNKTGDKVYNWKGGYKDYYGQNWNYQRNQCRKRDNNTCGICNLTSVIKSRNMDVDHIIPFEAFEDYQEANQLSNLWCLCPSCHAKKTNWQVKYGRISTEEWKKLTSDLMERKYIWQTNQK